MRVVFDTNTLISALLFRGEMAWLVRHWQDPRVIPLACHETAGELLRVLAYPKFGLSLNQQEVVAARFVAFIERVQLAVEPSALVRCRDSRDQIFLELAFQGKANVLVTGDGDLLALSGTAPFAIEPPVAYRQRADALGLAI